MAKTLYVGNLSYSTSEAGLQDAFSKYGAHKPRVLENRGFGFVDIDDDQLDAAIEEMNGTSLDGRKIVVNEARPREPREGGGGRGYGGGRGSGW
jgi:RNA recognition motif-containing protein